MPFVKVTRDKRGYEHVYLIHTVTRRNKPPRQRVLYWFRTPPGVKVGREPFDDTLRRLLEAQNPDVVFDWAALAKLPAPPPDVEQWRERRRADKAAKVARRAEQATLDAGDGSEMAESSDAFEASDSPDELPAVDTPQPGGESESAPLADPEAAVHTGAVDTAAPGRRGRRGGRRRGRPPMSSERNDASGSGGGEA